MPAQQRKITPTASWRWPGEDRNVIWKRKIFNIIGKFGPDNTFFLMVLGPPREAEDKGKESPGNV